MAATPGTAGVGQPAAEASILEEDQQGEEVSTLVADLWVAAGAAVRHRPMVGAASPDLPRQTPDRS